MKLAIHQTAGAPRDPAATLAALAGTAADAAGQGADLLVLPEMWLTGYDIGDDAHRLAEPADGPSADAVAEIARQHGLAILYGYPERAGEAVYNSAQLVDAGGTRLLNARKTHLYGGEERRLFRPGDALCPVVGLAGLRLSVLICYDVEFPEAVRRAALAGAELVAVPTALFQPHGFVASHVVPVRAWENGVFLAYANRSGAEGELTYVGGSAIWSPDGQALAAAGADAALIVADLDPAALTAARAASPYLTDRRPQLYGR